MRNLFVPHDIAVILRETGFNEPCFGWWNTPEDILLFNAYGNVRNIELMGVGINSNQVKPTAPLYYQVRAWLHQRGFNLHDYYLADSNRFGCDVYDLSCNLLEQNETKETIEEAYDVAIKQAINKL